MFKKISTTIINLLFKCLLKWGILHLAKILFAILFPLYLASLIKKRLLPVCVFIALLCVYLSFLLIFYKIRTRRCKKFYLSFKN